MTAVTSARSGPAQQGAADGCSLGRLRPATVAAANGAEVASLVTPRPGSGGAAAGRPRVGLAAAGAHGLGLRLCRADDRHRQVVESIVRSTHVVCACALMAA